MMNKTKVAVCAEVRIKHSTQSQHHVEFLMLNLVVRKETARLCKVRQFARLEEVSHAAYYCDTCYGESVVMNVRIY